MQTYTLSMVSVMATQEEPSVNTLDVIRIGENQVKEYLAMSIDKFGNMDWVVE